MRRGACVLRSGWCRTPLTWCPFHCIARLVFEARGTIASLVGQHIQADVPGDVEIREWATEDIEHLATLDTCLTGIARKQDMRFFHAQPPHIAALVQGQLVGYLCFLRTEAGTFFWPRCSNATVGLTRTDSVRGGARTGKGPAHCASPTRHATLLRELLAVGFRVETLQTYMVRGAWQTPDGAELLALFPEAL